MGLLALKVKALSGTPWRLLYSWDDENDKLAIEQIEGGIVSASFVSYPLSLDVFRAIVEYLPGVRIDDRAKEWYLKETSTIFKANTTKAGNKLEKRIELELPYAHRLYNFQTVGAQWLVDIKRGILADEPGLGKTITSLAAADLTGAKRILVVTLAGTVQKQWKEAAEKWLGCTAVIAEGTKEQRVAALRTKARVKVVSYGMLADRKTKKHGSANPYHEFLFNAPWDVIIIDEAHCLQNKDSKRSKNAARLKAPYLFLLTGTPLWNRVPSCYNLLHLLAPKAYSSYWAFVEKYCKMQWTPFGRKIGDLKPSMLPVLKKELAPYMLRRTTDDVFTDLPEVVFTPIEYELPDYFYTILRQMKNKRVDYNGVEKIYAGSGSILSDMRKLCSNPKLLGFDFASPKDEEIKQIVEEHVSTGRQVLIFTWHRSYAEHVADLVQELGYTCPFIHGQVAKEAREVILDVYRKKGFQCLVATLPTLGVGIDLPMIDVCVFAEADWTPAMIEQGWRRIYRIGSNGKRFVYFLFARNTIEARIHAIFTKKADIAEDILLFESTV